MKGKFWKRSISLLIMLLLIVASVPLQAAAETAGKLVNIAKNCTITVPSEQSGKPASNLVDGDASTLWVNNGGDWPC